MEQTATVKEIHGAVDLEVSRLLMDEPYDQTKIKALQALGFTSAENVIDSEDYRRNHSVAVYYQHKYPMYKFITAHQMEKIRGKFGLREGAVQKFKGAIPNKNLNEMLQFKVMRKDIVKDSSISDMLDSLERLSSLSRGGIPSFAEFLSTRTAGPVVDISREAEDRWESSRRRYDDGQDTLSYSMSDFKTNAQKIKALREERENPNEMLDITQINKEFPGTIKITADPALFLAPDPVLDPIVTVGVKGGYLIITAWGDEASDPDVTNQKMN
jgi:hypothetical protein